MKRVLFLAIFIIITSSFLLPLTNSDKINKAVPPSYSFAALDPATGKIKAKLELSTAVFQKPKGKTTTTSSYTISGTKSSIRLKIAEAVFEIISDQSTGTLNPSYYISLYKLNTGKTNRTLTTNNDGSANSSTIQISIVSIEQLMYRISVNGAILPGEYAFVDKTTTMADGNVTVWTFGID